MTKLRVAFRNFTNSPKKGEYQKGFESWHNPGATSELKLKN